MNVTFVDVSKDIVLMTFVANFLLNNFSTLSVYHSFVSHFLVTISSVFVHLMSFSDPFAIRSYCSFCVFLVTFFYWSSIWSHFHRSLIGKGLEASTSSPQLIHISHHTDRISHVTFHFIHHLIHPSKHTATTHTFEKRIILERILDYKYA